MALLKSSFYSSHKYCFICRRKYRYKFKVPCKLFNLKDRDIINIWLKHGISLRRGVRCCGKHLDKNGFIKSDQIPKIPLIYKQVSEQEFFMVTYLKSVCLKPKQLIIDEFRDIDTLSEETCIKITGWPKKQFIQFSTLITSIYETKNRNKYQLIALYRYWLSKGIDQESLTNFMSETNQQQISDLLESIRNAVYKDFTPWFLGAKSKSREFFIQQNTITVNELFELKYDELALIMDGTHAKIGKSSNNQFQWDSYSDQKKFHFIKPFLICCANGYIVDCYFPFKAKVNDAKIIEFILKHDYKLRELLLPDKTLVILDKGHKIYL